MPDAAAQLRALVSSAGDAGNGASPDADDIVEGTAAPLDQVIDTAAARELLCAVDGMVATNRKDRRAKLCVRLVNTALDVAANGDKASEGPSGDKRRQKGAEDANGAAVLGGGALGMNAVVRDLWEASTPPPVPPQTGLGTPTEEVVALDGAQAEFVGGKAGLTALRERLERALAPGDRPEGGERDAGGEGSAKRAKTDRHVIAFDTEWCTGPDGKTCIATIQLAFLEDGAERAFVVDAFPNSGGADAEVDASSSAATAAAATGAVAGAGVEERAELESMLRWLFSRDSSAGTRVGVYIATGRGALEVRVSRRTPAHVHPVLLGYACTQDLRMLVNDFGIASATPVGSPLSEGGGVGVRCPVVDFQHLAVARGCGTVSASPSLRSTVQFFIGLALDKREQQSQWELRPLSESQFRYAALDALVLLRLLPSAGFAIQ